MERLHFNRLPGATRARIIDATHGRGTPQPLFLESVSSLGAAGWWVLGLIAGMIVLAVAVNGFGSTYHFEQHPVLIVVYGALVGFALWCFVRGLRTQQLTSGAPYKRGVYVFPLALLDAREDELLLYPLSELLQMQPTHHHVNGVYQRTSFNFLFEGGKTYIFNLSGKVFAESALERFRQARIAVGQAVEARDVARLNALDLFFEPRMNGSWQSADPAHGPTVARLPRVFAFGAIASFALGAALAVPGFFLRNRLSDDAAFRELKNDAARGYSSSWEIKNYRESGGRHVEEVRKQVVPAAALAEANKLKDPRALRAVLAVCTDAENKPAIEAALTTAVAEQFERAKAAGSVTALRAFIAQNPGAPQFGAARAAVHALFEKALAEFEATAAKSDPNLIPFTRALLAQLESFDSPAVAVEFVHIPSKSLADADARIEADLSAEERRAGFAGASSYFDAASSRARETILVSLLQSAFTKVFPADMLQFQQMAEGSAGAAANAATKPAKTSIAGSMAAQSTSSEPAEMLLGQIDAEYFSSDSKHTSPQTSTQRELLMLRNNYGDSTNSASRKLESSAKQITEHSPRLVVRYNAEWSGSTYRNDKTNRSFVGIFIKFAVAFAVEATSAAPAVCPAKGYTGICPLTLAVFVKPPSSFSVTASAFMNRNAYAPTPTASDSQVYNVMASRAFEQLSDKLQLAFFDRILRSATVAADSKDDRKDDDDDDALAAALRRRRLQGASSVGTAARLPTVVPSSRVAPSGSPVNRR